MEYLKKVALCNYYSWLFLAVVIYTLFFPVALAVNVSRRVLKAALEAWNDTTYEFAIHWTRKNYQQVKRKHTV